MEDNKVNIFSVFGIIFPNTEKSISNTRSLLICDKVLIDVCG